MHVRVVHRMRRRWLLMSTVVLTVVGTGGSVLLAPSASAGTPADSGARSSATAAAATGPLFGGWSKDYGWYNANVGPVQIYRTYDPGFQFSTWKKTYAYTAHGNAPEDYSFQLPPKAVASGADDAILTTFIASTPPDLIVTNYHEPEQEIDAGKFSFADFKNAIIRLATIVHAQNAIDGGHRRVSVVLMRSTITGLKGRKPMNYWPGRDPVTGKNYADLISFDVYALPHNTETPGVPQGFTDGINWQSSQTLLDPSINFAKSIGSPWMVSEFGFLEDIHNPMHKANAIKDFVAYAESKGALNVEYWDSIGGRADWRLRNSTNALNAWKSVVDGVA